MTAGGQYGYGWTCSNCGLWIQGGMQHVCIGRTSPPPTFYPIYAAPGWICPRCGVVHAPSVLRCECKPKEGENG